jgi:hypothetical protein
MAMPMHKGSATRKTTTEEKTSRYVPLIKTSPPWRRPAKCGGAAKRWVETRR